MVITGTGRNFNDMNWMGESVAILNRGIKNWWLEIIEEKLPDVLKGNKGRRSFFKYMREEECEDSIS